MNRAPYGTCLQAIDGLALVEQEIDEYAIADRGNGTEINDVDDDNDNQTDTNPIDNTITTNSIVGVLAVNSVISGLSEASQAAYLNLVAARELWNGPRTYSMIYQRSCHCRYPFTQLMYVDIKEGQKGFIRYAQDAEKATEDGTPVAPVTREVYTSVYTIEYQFDLIENAILENKAEIVEVSYDEQMGYPTIIYINYDLAIADDEFEIHSVVSVETSK